MIKFLLLCLCCSAQLLWAQTPDKLKVKAMMLKSFMDKNHYQPLVWNDSSSERLYKKWLGYLDREKLFFTTADIAVLEPFKTKLDEEINGKSWEFFKVSAGIYRKRLLKADSLIKNVLSKPLDFSLSETIEIPFRSYAGNDTEIQQRWKKYCKWQVLRKIADDNDSVNVSADMFVAAEKKTVAQQKIQEEKYLQRLLGDNAADFETDLQDIYLNSIAWCYDPHSSYMNLGRKDEFETSMSASEYTVGFEMDENEKGEAVISFLQPGGSAWRSGQLHKGDVVLAIKIGKSFKNITDISDDDLEEALGGTAKAEAEIKIRTLAGETKTVKLVKEKISSEEDVVKSYVLQGKSNVGYINLPGFYSREGEDERDNEPNYNGCANDVSKEIVKLKKDSIAGLILDLRYNGGGSIWEAMQLAGIFIDIGPVASMKDREGKIRFLKDPNRGTIYDGPLMILINGASASASEFVAAVLQDYNRAVIVGGTTYGKGTAQVVKPMDTVLNPNKKYDDFVKVTGEKFYRVNGSTTQWKGVEPDIVLPDMYSGDSHKERSSISALQPDMSKAGVYRPSAALPVGGLGSKSVQRTAANTYFKAVNTYTNLTASYEKGRVIPLTWAAYLSQYKIAKALFKSLDEENVPLADHLPVRNNSFDRERFEQSATYSKEVNEAYLKNVSADPVISEARAIMLDWTGKP